MRTKLSLLALAATVAAAPAASPTEGMKTGTPSVKSVSALAFGPGGVLFLGDPTAATVFAVATNDTAAGQRADLNKTGLDNDVAAMLGVQPKDVLISDVKVNPASGSVYLAVTRGKGPDGMPVVMKLSADGKLAEFPLKDVMFSSVALPNPTDNAKRREEAITSLAYVDGRVVVAGLSNEEFASTLRAVPFPFQTADKGTSVEIFHGAHGKLETQAPVRTFTPYKIGGADYLLAAYTCTPLVKIPLTDLKPGAKVKGTTIAELGNRNKPLDMVVYTKDGKEYVLMANSARGVMKIPAEPFADAQPITARPKGPTAGVGYETVDSLKDVMHLDKYDDTRAVVLIQPKGGEATLKTIPLP